MFDSCIPHVWWENQNLGLVKSHFFMVYFVHCCFVRRHCKWSSTLVGGWATSPRQAKGRQPRADNRIAIFHDYVRLPAYTNSYVIVCYNYVSKLYSKLYLHIQNDRNIIEIIHIIPFWYHIPNVNTGLVLDLMVRGFHFWPGACWWFVHPACVASADLVLCVKHVGWLDGLLGVAGGCWGLLGW